MRIIVHGQPAPQGSKRAFRNKFSGKIQMTESSKTVKPWREAVKHAVFDAHQGARALDEPLRVRMIFSFRRPVSHYRAGKNSHLLRDNAPKYPCGTPDLSKLLRSTEDALTDAGVWRDDSRVSVYERAAKVWCSEDRESLPLPGAVIVILRFGEEEEPF